MEKVASCSKYVDSESTMRWLKGLPRKFDMDVIHNYLAILKRGYYLFWSEDKGLKILK